MNVNHIHTELNKIDNCLEKIYAKFDKISWASADIVEVDVIQDYVESINAKLSNCRSRIGSEFKNFQKDYIE